MAMMSLEAQISGRQVMQGLLVEEMKEVLPLVEAGALGSSEKFQTGTTGCINFYRT